MSAYATLSHLSLPPIAGRKHLLDKKFCVSNNYQCPTPSEIPCHVFDGTTPDVETRFLSGYESRDQVETMAGNKKTKRIFLDVSVISASIDPRILVSACMSSKQDKCSRSRSANSANSSNLFDAGFDDAIKFELLVTLYGRKYTAKRTISSLMQLRDDLITETYEISKNIIKRENRRGKQRRKLVGMRGKNHIILNKNTLDSTNKDGKELTNADSPIPLLPVNMDTCDTPYDLANFKCRYNFLSGDLDGINDTVLPMGGAGRSFSAVQALLRSYCCPAMNRWFHRVLEIIQPENSPVLTRFLWESVGKTTIDADLNHGQREVGNSNRKCNLLRIAEDSEQEDE